MINLKLSVKDIAMIGFFVAISSITRIGMSYFPNIQISTVLIILITVNYGLKYGLLVAILTPLTSNMILGQGIWTLWQVISWSLISILAFPFRKFKDDIYIMGLLSLICGYIFGLTISIQSCMTYGLLGNKFIIYYLSGLGFDTLHAIGNMMFCIAMLKKFNSISEKYKNNRIKGEI